MSVLVDTENRISPQSNQVLGSYSYKRKQRISNISGGLLDRIKEVANSFFQNDSSFGRKKRKKKETRRA